MICEPCGNRQHAVCITANAEHDYSSCDCQHKTGTYSVGVK